MLLWLFQKSYIGSVLQLFGHSQQGKYTYCSLIDKTKFTHITTKCTQICFIQTNNRTYTRYKHNLNSLILEFNRHKMRWRSIWLQSRVKTLETCSIEIIYQITSFLDYYDVV